MVICSEYNFISKKVMTEMLQCAYGGQQLATRSAIVALGRIHNSRKERNGSLYDINFLGEDSSHSNVRGVRVQNTTLLREWEGQGGSLNQGLLQGIERLLRFLSPFEPGHLTGETGKWLGNGGEPFNKPAIIGGQVKERPYSQSVQPRHSEVLYTVNTWHSGVPRRDGVVAYLEVLTYLRFRDSEAWPKTDLRSPEADSLLRRKFVDGIKDVELQKYLRLHAASDDFATTVSKARHFIDASELSRAPKKPAIRTTSPSVNY